MKKLFGSLALVATLFITTACGGGGNTPSGKAEKALNALQKKQYSEFVEYVYISTKKDDTPEGRKMLADMLQTKSESFYAKNGGFKSYKILNETIAEDGKTAVVQTEITFGNGEVKKDDLKLVKTDAGDWMVDMNK